MQNTTLTTKTNRQVILAYKFLNDDFCNDARQYWAKKHNFRHWQVMSSYFIQQSIHEFIIDFDIDPVYESEEYTPKFTDSGELTISEKLFTDFTNIHLR